MPRTTEDTTEDLRIHRSTNYDEFVLLEDNRDVNNSHIDNLAEEGNTTTVDPITVNERMEIIDGQHRFRACRDNRWPVYYIKRPGLTISTARKMNIKHRSWNLDDFIRSFSQEGNQNYIKFQELREEYGMIATVILIAIYDGYKKNVSNSFRNGELVIEDEAATRTRLDKLAELSDTLDSKLPQSFYQAYVEALKLLNFDHARMIRKSRQVGNQLLRRYNNVNDWLRAFEEVYNYAMPEGNRLRLY